jgi:hypothetical protein
LDTGWTDVKNAIHVLKNRDTVDEFMGIVQIVVARMTEALMPKKALCSSFESVDVDCCVDVFMERKGMEGDWDEVQLGSKNGDLSFVEGMSSLYRGSGTSSTKCRVRSL